jgi:D-alanyl-D-alanine carboxypeptidase (penicillin-binding protein 5/6)
MTRSLRIILNQIKKHPIIYIYGGVFVSVCIFIVVNNITFKTVVDVIIRPDPFVGIELNAKGVYVFDESQNKVLYEKDSHISLPIASITKLLTIKCSIDILGQNTLVDVPQILFKDNPDLAYSYTDKLDVKTLSILTLIESSNMGAEILAEKIGSYKILNCMNGEAKTHDLKETRFLNVTGLDEGMGMAGGYSSAENVVRILQEVVRAYPEVYTKTANSSYEITTKNGIIHNVINTNIVSDKLSGLLASKTGFTNLAGGSLTFVVNVLNKHNIYVALLGGTIESRFSDALIINEKILEYYK